MRIAPFQLEKYFARYEFSARYLLCSSDCEALSLQELLALGDPESRGLWDGLHLGYTEAPGHPRLREAVSTLYPGLSPDQVITAVPEEGIFLAMNALLAPGDHVVALTPAYQSLYEIARALGCVVTPWPLERRENAWHLDLASLHRLVTPETRLVVVNFPHNPTGFLPTKEEFRAVVAAADRVGAWLFSDEMYHGLEHQEGDALPPAALAYRRGVSLSGLSKTYGLPGLRAGWLALQDRELMEHLRTLKDYTTICGCAPGEILALMALSARETIRGRNLALVRKNLAQGEAYFRGLPGLFTWIPPRGGSIAFPALREDLPAHDFCEDTVAESGVMVAPSSCFDVSGNHIRIGYGRQNFSEVLEHFDASLGRRGLR